LVILNSSLRLYGSVLGKLSENDQTIPGNIFGGILGVAASGIHASGCGRKFLVQTRRNTSDKAAMAEMQFVKSMS
jgi:hypothetical protein